VDTGCRLVPFGAGKESLNYGHLEGPAFRIPYPPPLSSLVENRGLGVGSAPGGPLEGRCLRMGAYVSARKATAGAHAAGGC